MAIAKIAVISLLFLFSDAARFPNTVDENMVVLRQPPEKQEAGTEVDETVTLVLRPVGDKDTDTESSLPSDKMEKATSVSLPGLVDSFEHLRPFRPCLPGRHRHRFRGVDVVPLTFGDDVNFSRKSGEEEEDSTEEAAKHTVVAVHEELVNREAAAEGDQEATKESKVQKEEEAKTTPTKIILLESDKERDDGGRKKKEPKKKKDREDSDSDSDSASDSDSDDEMEKEMKKRKRKKEKKSGWWKWFRGLWD